MSQSTPEAYIKGCLKGDRTAQENFYRYFAPRMMGVCLRYARSKSQAEDLLQEAFVKIFERLPQYKHSGSVHGWVHRLVVTTAIDHYRSQVRLRHEVELEEASEISADNCDMLDMFSTQEILALINKLPDGYRLVLNLFAIEGFSHKEISEQLGIEEKTSSSQLHKARKMLLKLMRSQELLVGYKI